MGSGDVAQPGEEDSMQKGLDGGQAPPVIITPQPDVDDPMQGPLPALTTEAVPEAVHTSVPGELFAA